MFARVSWLGRKIPSSENYSQPTREAARPTLVVFDPRPSPRRDYEAQTIYSPCGVWRGSRLARFARDCAADAGTAGVVAEIQRGGHGDHREDLHSDQPAGDGNRHGVFASSLAQTGAGCYRTLRTSFDRLRARLAFF